MDVSKDYYAVLGLARNAEPAVVRAAYKALAQHYHPDQAENKDEATKTFQEINEAHSVLSDEQKRRSYDHARGKGPQATGNQFDDDSAAESQNNDPVYRGWEQVCEIYPELEDCAAKLDRIAFRLGYVYRAMMIDIKEYKHGVEIAEVMEREFLETYFGSHDVVIDFAKHLISQRQKGAAKKLNQLILLFGSNHDDDAATRIVQKIKSEFNIIGYGGYGKRGEALVFDQETLMGLGSKKR